MHSPIKLLVATIPALASACVGPPVNGPTLDLIKGFESFRGDVYDDGAGNPTIGYGHLCPDWSCSDVTFPQPLTEETAAQLLASDLIGYQDAVTNAFADPVTLNDNQYGALVSWTYNIGNGNMQSSDLVSRINAGEDVVAVTTDELPQWIHSNGQVMNGLIRRRQEELNLFNAPSNVGALPAPC